MPWEQGKNNHKVTKNIFSLFAFSDFFKFTNKFGNFFSWKLKFFQKPILVLHLYWVICQNIDLLNNFFLMYKRSATLQSAKAKNLYFTNSVLLYFRRRWLHFSMAPCKTRCTRRLEKPFAKRGLLSVPEPGPQVLNETFIFFFQFKRLPVNRYLQDLLLFSHNTSIENLLLVLHGFKLHSA